MSNNEQGFTISIAVTAEGYKRMRDMFAYEAKAAQARIDETLSAMAYLQDKCAKYIGYDCVDVMVRAGDVFIESEEARIDDMKKAIIECEKSIKFASAKDSVKE